MVTVVSITTTTTRNVLLWLWLCVQHLSLLHPPSMLSWLIILQHFPACTPYHILWPKVSIKFHLLLECKPFSPCSFISCQLRSYPSIIHYHMHQQFLLLPKCSPYTCRWQGCSFRHHFPCHLWHGESTGTNIHWLWSLNCSSWNRGQQDVNGR